MKVIETMLEAVVLHEGLKWKLNDAKPCFFVVVLGRLKEATETIYKKKAL